MTRIIFLLLLLVSINTQPVFAQTQSVQVKTNLTFFSEKFLGVQNGHRHSNKGTTRIDLKYDLKNLSSQL